MPGYQRIVGINLVGLGKAQEGCGPGLRSCDLGEGHELDVSPDTRAYVRREGKGSGEALLAVLGDLRGDVDAGIEGAPGADIDGEEITDGIITIGGGSGHGASQHEE